MQTPRRPGSLKEENAALRTQLAEYEARFRALTNIAPDILWTAKPDGTFTYANEEWFRYTGITAEQNASQWPELIHPDDYEQATAKWKEALQTGAEYEIEVRNRRHDGEYRWFLTRATPVRNEHGEIVGWCGCTADIHDRKLNEATQRENEVKYQALFELAGIGNAQVDVATGRFMRTNRKLAEMLGYTEEELKQRTFSEVTYPADKERNLEDFRRIQQRESDSYSLEKRYIRKDGSILWAQLNVTRVDDTHGQPLYLITNVQDITQRKQVESDYRFLADLSEVLIALIEPDDIIAAVTQRLGRYLYAQRCFIEEVNENTDQISIHEDYRVGGLSLRGLYPLSTFPTKVLDELRNGNVAVIEDATTDPRVADLYASLYGSANIRAFVALPRMRNGQWVGTLYVTSSHTRPWPPELITFLRSIAVRTWLTLENARLFKAAQVARQRAERAADRTFRLQAVTAALSQALTPDKVMEVILREGLVALDAEAGSVAFHPLGGKDEGGDIILTGYPEPFARILNEVAFKTQLPVTDVLRSGQPIWIETTEARNILYPHLAEIYPALGVGALAGVPLIVGGKVVGAIEFHFVGGHTFEVDDRTLLLTLATQCAQALERARPYQAEQHARAAADATARVWAFLAQAGQTLARSLDYTATLEAAAQVVVPYLADFSLIYMIEANTVQGLAYTHHDLEKQPFVEPFGQLFKPASESLDCPAAQVFITGKSSAFEDWRDARCTPTTEATRQAVDVLKPQSIMFAPLNVRGVTVGVFILVTSDSERRYNNADLSLVEELARRVALAAENARLYAEAQALSAELDARVRTRTEQLRISHEQLQQLSVRLERMREEERTRIAREVHDELGGALTSLKMGLVRLKREPDSSTARWQEQVNDMTALLDSTVQTVRRIASDLRPAILDELGLLPALEWQAQEFERRTGIVCDYSSSFPEDTELRLDQETATAIFRVFQESLTNIARHAQATLIEAKVRREGAELFIYIHDNGRGIPTGLLSNSKSLGLVGMRERIRQVGGHLEIDGKPGKGTSIFIRVPLNL